MSITAIKGPRNDQMALCSCDQCCAEHSVKAMHVMGTSRDKNGRFKLELSSPSQVHEKLQSLGWGIVKGKHYCPRCEAARKPPPITALATIKEPEPMAATTSNVAQIRQPTSEQEVDIIVTLSAVYDRKAKRYQGQETDKTVAETVGGGVMPGWVAAIRDAKFGPAGNEEVNLIRAEIAKIKADHTAGIDALRADINKAVAAMVRRLDACVAAHDRRVG